MKSPMRLMVKARYFLASLFHRRRTEEELDQELRYHLDQETAENIRAGMPPEEANLAARRALGAVSVLKDQCRDAWGIGFFETLGRDLRYAAHMFRRRALFTLVALATLALGIGANITVFTVAENILLHPLQVRDSGNVLFLNWGESVNMSYPNYVDFRDRNASFSSLAAYRLVTSNLSIHPRDNAYAVGYEATGNYFEALGVEPELGRFFGPEEDDRPGAHPVVVLSDRFWRTRLNADVNAIGGTVRISGSPFSVIGVAPASFVGTEVIVGADYWVPMSMVSQVEPRSAWIQSRGAGNIFALGRLKAGLSWERAEADLDRIGAALAQQYPDAADPRARFHLSRPGLFGNSLRRPVERLVGVFAAVAGLVLLLACVNLAGMLLARAGDRRREVGIRLAIGASRWQLVRQLLTESLLLASAGGALGFALALLLFRVVSFWRPALTLPVNIALHPDAAVLGFGLLSVLGTSLLFGLAPALRTVRVAVTPGQHSIASNSPGRWNARDLLVAAQVAISVALAICSVLVVRSEQNAHSLKLGLQPEGAAAIAVDLSLQDYDVQRIRAFDRDLLAKISAAPGIQDAGLISALPLTQRENNGTISRPDRPVPKPWERRFATLYDISPGYFRAAGTRLLSGRDFDAHDRPGSPFRVIVNQACAHLLFGAENPVGQHLRLGDNPSAPGIEIIGMVEDGKYEYLAEPPHPVVFLPLAFTASQFTTLVARSAMGTEQVTDLLRKTVFDLDPQLTVVSAGSLQDQLGLALLPVRMVASVLGVFGGLALLMAATGLFGLVAYAVSRRTREIGLRMALGAGRAQILSSVMTRTALLCSVGAVLGTVAALAAGKLLSVVLYGVSASDPTIYLSALLLVAGVALMACWHPALRAIRIDPAVTLRDE